MTYPAITPSMGFDDVARAVLAHLREHVPMGFWSVTRVENGRQTYLYLDDNDYGLTAGQAHQWEDSFCIHMASGTGPAVAPDVQAVPAYARAGINDTAAIGSYAGSVISEPNGALFGAICGIDPDVKHDDPRLVAAGPLLQLLGTLLTMALAADRAREDAAALLLAAEIAAETDVLTGLYNRRAWERLLEEEEVRFRRLGDPTVVVMTDLDFLKTVNDTQGHDAGDAYIRQAASALRAATRGSDYVARLGGDEFGLLLRHCDESQADGRVRDIYRLMTEAGVATSLGWAPITVLRGFPAALAEADSAMYAAKRARRAARVPSA